MSHRYSPGPCAAVVAERGLVVLAGEAAPDLLGRLWQELRGGADLQDLIEELTRVHGVRDLPGFAIALLGSTGTQLAIRGGATLHVRTAEGRLEVSGEGISTWVERFIPDGREVQVAFADGPGEELPLLGGIVYVSAVTLSLGPDSAPASHPPAEPEQSARSAGERAPHGPEAWPSEAALSPPSQPSGHAAGPPHPDAPTEAMQAAPAEPPAPAPTPPAPPPEPIRDPGPPRNPAPPTPSLGRLVFSTGEVVELTGTIVIGRAPSAGRRPDGRLPVLHEVRSPNKEISRSHLEITADALGIHARDLGSSNGTVLQRAGQPPAQLPETLSEPVYPGDVLDLGEDIQIRLEP